MSLIPIRNIGTIGIVNELDAPPHMLPLEAWSDGKNVRVSNGRIVKGKGHKAIFDPPTVPPYWSMIAPTLTSNFWMYAGLADVYTFEGAAHTKITRASGTYAATAVDLWNGGVLGGIPIINNGVDIPQYWSNISHGQLLQDLTNWPATLRAKVFRPFKNFGVALNLIDSGVNYPHRIRTSHPADPGTVPTSWDPSDPTKDVTERELTDVTAGLIRDGMELGDLFIIYKDSSTWGLQWVGGFFIFRLFKIFETSGILSRHCVASLPRGRGHFVLTGDDLITHDGQRLQSVVDRRWRRFLSNNIDTDNFDRSFCVTNFAEREAWACFPEVGKTWPSLALTWSFVDGTIGVRELANISHISNGAVEETVSQTWDSDSQVWDADPEAWDTQVSSAFLRNMLGSDPTNTKLRQMDVTEQFSGTDMVSFVERKGLSIAGLDRAGNPYSDEGVRKMAIRIWPLVRNGPVNIRVGAHETPNGAITYTPAQSFDPATQEYLDLHPPPNGRYLAVRFESDGNVTWGVEGYSLDIQLVGKQS